MFVVHYKNQMFPNCKRANYLQMSSKPCVCLHWSEENNRAVTMNLYITPQGLAKM